ncbi:hypothetical protein HF086_015087 [Spodoptera exigua]|uniref:Uncharacterized protein n=1 Tax=Spodoptera exigua TaxID=7107 RepID=A0A922MPP7_SPOEX|nr:hypothetical protein HF086_015087 [Spodoptera exigua]
MQLPNQAAMNPYKMLKFGEVSVAATDDALVPVDPHHPPLAVSVCPAPAHPASPSSSPAAAYAAAHNIRPQWNFYKADYQLLYTMLTSADWSTLYETHDLDDIFMTSLVTF